MQTTRRAVRYYIDREADTPVIRSVPVSQARPPITNTAQLPATERVGGQDESASTTYNASEGRRRNARRRLAEMVQSTVRRHRNQTS